MKATTATKKKTSPKVETVDTSLVLRVCAPDFVSKNSFIWPSEIGAIATAPDWKDTTECGNGLHGWLYGQGDHDCADHWNTEGANWMVLEVVTSEVVMLGDKCKFPRAKVRFIGTKSAAADYLIANEPRAASVAVIGGAVTVGDKGSAIGGALSSLTGGNRSTLTGGDRSTLTGGNRSTLTGGDYSTLTGGNYSTLTGGYGSTLTGGYRSTLTGGNRSTLTGGDYSTLTGGDYSTLTGGDGSTLTGGYGSTLTGGNRSTLTGGDYSTLTGGDRSTLTGGDRSTLTGGDGSTLTGGDYSTLTGGYCSELRISWWDSKTDRYRTTQAYVDEDGIKANVKYQLNAEHKFVEVTA